MSKPARKATEPLRTRHVFLDTEVYRRAGFNISNTQFALLAKEIDAQQLADAAWKGFLNTLITRLRGHSVLALDTPARIVFERYFAGLAPFEQRGSKEFPDAFVVEGIARYCTSNDISMYVVSGDAALRRAAESHAPLIPLQTLDEVLAAAATAAGEAGDIEALVDEIFASPGFDDQVTAAIEADLDFVDFVYYGPLTDGNVVSTELNEIVSLDEYDVAAFDDSKIGLIIQVNATLDAKVRYFDEKELRDKDDDIIPTELETSSRIHARLKIYVSIDLRSLRFLESELLTRDIIVE